jgi:hypothetical protein
LVLDGDREIFFKDEINFSFLFYRKCNFFGSSAAKIAILVLGMQRHWKRYGAVDGSTVEKFVKKKKIDSG